MKKNINSIFATINRVVPEGGLALWLNTPDDARNKYAWYSSGGYRFKGPRGLWDYIAGKAAKMGYLYEKDTSNGRRVIF